VEKVMYLLWCDGRDPERWTRDVAETLVPALHAQRVFGLQVNADDAEVGPVTMRMSADGDPPGMFVSLWVPDARRERLASIDEAVRAHGRSAAYLVEEHEPLPNAWPAPLRSRTRGYVNVALLRRPARLDRDAWLAEWLGRHTRVAMETQSTRRYVQNVVRRRLGSGPAIDGIVEELFPPEAVTDLHAMFDAAGNDVLLAERLAAMHESVGRFLDVDQLTVVPTSEYVFRKAV